LISYVDGYIHFKKVQFFSRANECSRAKGKRM